MERRARQFTPNVVVFVLSRQNHAFSIAFYICLFRSSLFTIFYNCQYCYQACIAIHLLYRNNTHKAGDNMYDKDQWQRKDAGSYKHKATGATVYYITERGPFGGKVSHWGFYLPWRPVHNRSSGGMNNRDMAMSAVLQVISNELQKPVDG